MENKEFRFAQRKKIKEIQERKTREMEQQIKKERREEMVRLILDKDKPRPESTRKVVLI